MEYNIFMYLFEEFSPIRYCNLGQSNSFIKEMFHFRKSVLMEHFSKEVVLRYVKPKKRDLPNINKDKTEDEIRACSSLLYAVSL